MLDSSVVITFKASRAFLRRLDAYARKAGKPRSEVIREAVMHYVNNHDGRRKKIKFRVRRVVLS